MGMLMMAVVEITTLVATCHASVPTKTVLPRDPRKRLRRDLKRGAVAYIDALSITWPNPLRDLSLLDIQGDSTKEDAAAAIELPRTGDAVQPSLKSPDGSKLALSPGMLALAEIHQGPRTLLEISAKSSAEKGGGAEAAREQ